MNNKKINFITEVGIFSALGFVLDWISETLMTFIWPNGGAISLGMLAIFIMAFRHGLKGGLLTGSIIGVLLMILMLQLNVHPVQMLLDYLLAFTAGGVAGVFATKVSKEIETPKKALIYVYLGVFIGIFLRYIFSVLSGAFYWAPIIFEEAVSMKTAFSFSLLYNLQYLAPTLGVNLALMTLITLRYQFLITTKE